jgi:hypothetical protein
MLSATIFRHWWQLVRRHFERSARNNREDRLCPRLHGGTGPGSSEASSEGGGMQVIIERHDAVVDAVAESAKSSVRAGASFGARAPAVRNRPPICVCGYASS